MDLMFFINALLKRKWVIIICTVFGLVASLLFTLTKKNMYLSAATYSTGFTMKQQVKMNGDEGLNIFEIDQRFKNVIETFRSPVVLCMLSYDLMLHDLTDKMPFTTLTAKQKNKQEYQAVDFNKARRILLEKKATKEILKAYDPEENKVYQLILLYQYDAESILNDLSVDRVAGTDYLNIIYKSENPEMSAFVVNTIGKEFISFFASINDTRTEESAGKLDSLAAMKKKEIEEKTQRLSEYKKTFNSANIEDKGKAALAMAQDQQAQLNTESAKLNTLKGTLTSLNQQLDALGPETSAAATGNNTELVALHQKNRDLAVELVRKGGTDPTIEAQINSNQKRIDQLQPVNTSSGLTDRAERKKQRDDLKAQIINTRNEIEAQNQTIAALNAGILKYNNDAGSNAGADVLVKNRENEIDLLTKQYALMVGQLQNAENINVAPEINFKQTLKGQPAIRPEHSGRKVIIAGGAFAALVLSSLWILIIDFLDQSVRAPSIFSKVVNLKLLAVVTKISLKDQTLDDLFNMEQKSNPESEFDFVENLRKLRYEIEQSNKKIILFTSTKEGEGKTTIIESLARSFSLSKKRVLVIDTNFSHNTLTQELEGKPLLNQFVLNGEPNLTEKLALVKTQTKIPLVDIIGCNESIYSPDELLQNNNLLSNLFRISERYDYILMEGASLNFHAGTKELLKYADAVIAVFSAKSIIRQTDKESIKFLKNQKDKLIGAVLNEVEPDNLDL